MYMNARTDRSTVDKNHQWLRCEMTASVSTSFELLMSQRPKKAAPPMLCSGLFRNR